MGTKISWADESWNTIIGCSKVSAGCANCYAEKMAVRLRGITDTQCCRNRSQRNLTNAIAYGKATSKGKWTGETAFRIHELTKPLYWRTPRKIFVNSMGDTFHESVHREWTDSVFSIMDRCPQHEFKVLTKRSGRMKAYVANCDTPRRISDLSDKDGGKLRRAMKCSPLNGVWPLPNVHLGVTVENQDNVGRIADLIQTPAAKRFLSLEPLLGRIDIPAKYRENIDYVFIGCESGPGARLCTLDDIQYVIQQCQVAGVKVHVKQVPLDGRCNKNFKEWPKEVQAREV